MRKEDFVLRTTSVSPLDRDKGTLPLTREKCVRIFPPSDLFLNPELHEGIAIHGIPSLTTSKREFHHAVTSKSRNFKREPLIHIRKIQHSAFRNQSDAPNGFRKFQSDFNRAGRI